MDIAVEFVKEQSCGEWGDELILEDAKKLAVLIAREREVCAAAPEMAGLLQLALDTDHMDEDDPLFIASRDRIRALLERISK